MQMDTVAFWRHFDRKKAESHEILKRCQEFVAGFEHSGLLLRACAAMMGAPLLALATKGLKQSKGQPDVTRLLGKKHVGYGLPNVPPGSDHIGLWLKDGVPEEFRSEPYDLQMATLKEMIEYAERNDLTFGINGGSSYFPGASICVVFRRKGESSSYGPRF